jgi:uncharacterized protein (DUF2336 family)
MSGSPSLIAELEDTMASGSDPRRHDKLRKVTDLFVANSSQYGEEQVALFGGVIGRLAKDTDVAARAELSGRLAAIENAPPDVIRQLADDDKIEVAAPILTSSAQLDDAYLAGLASTKGRGHMLAIAAREHLSEQVTDALLTHGDRYVARTVANNASARVSDRGYDKLVDLAGSDASLAECVAKRQDIPQRHMRTLITVMPEPVRRRLAATNPQLAERIGRAIAEAEQQSARAAQRDYTQARLAVRALAEAGKLDDAAVQEFAETGQFEETVVSIAVLLRLPIEAVGRMLLLEPADTVLIAAKAAGLSWSAARHLLLLRTSGRYASPQDLETARLTFIRIKPETAKHGIEFYKARLNQE